jgi:hypothetical protein
LTSYRQLSKFCDGLSLEAAREIVSFKFKIDYLSIHEEEEASEPNNVDFDEKERSNEARSTKEAPYVDGPDDGVIKKTLEMMHGLTTLQLEGSTRLALVALSPFEDDKTLPHLSELSLDATFDGIDDPFHPSLYTNLSNYPQLGRVELFVRRSADSIIPSSASSPTFSLYDSPLRDIVALTLRGPFSASSSTSLLISLSPTLRILNLTDSSPASPDGWRITDLLESIREPDQLAALTLSCVHHRSEFEGNLPVSLSNFTDLSALALGGPFPPLNSTFYEVLARLPLFHLVFLSNFPVSLSHLRQVVLGPSKSETLRQVVLSNIEAKTSRLSDEEELEMFGPDWEEVAPAVTSAKWTAAFSKKELEQLLELVEEEGEGIVIEGTAVEALDREDYWIPMREEARLKHARQKEGEKYEGGQLKTELESC